LASVAVVSASGAVAAGVALAHGGQAESASAGSPEGVPVRGGPVVKDSEDPAAMSWIDPATGMGVSCAIAGTEPIPASVNTPAEAERFCHVGDLEVQSK